MPRFSARFTPPVVVLLAVLTLVGCRPKGLVVRDAPDRAVDALFPHHTLAQIEAQLVNHTTGLAAFRSEARLDIESPRQRGRLTSTIYNRRADSLYATLRGPFGIRVGAGLITPDSFFVHNEFQGQYYVGATSAVARVLPGAGTPAVLFDNLVGAVRPDAGVEWQVRTDSMRYRLLPPPGHRPARVYTIDPALWRVVRYEEFDSTGTLLGVCRYAHFDTIDGFVVPRRVVCESPPNATSVTLEHLRLTVNPATLTFRRPAPGDAAVQVVE